ncbi:MAG: PIG-L family deacetylase [Gemmatimonadetes bacterium]|nr:PIG-L family deacetylase [Gemmatimonadota bacterium]
MSDAGTSELSGRTVLVALAHPDDEALACGGTVARLVDGGARVVLVCASRGEMGSISDQDLLADRDLASVRCDELQASARVLGAQEVEQLGHDDGSLRWADALDDELRELLARYKPDAVITFDADGLYWHPDHIGMHERVTAAVTALDDETPALYYVSMPEGAMRALVDAAHLRGGAHDGGGLWGINPDAFGVHAPAPTLRIDVAPWVDRKLAAIRCHRTQLGPGSPFAWLDPDAASRWLGVELYRRAPSRRASTCNLLESLGERMSG